MHAIMVDFYSQIAANISDNSFDDDEEEEPGKTNPVSVDVDDIDANLFSSLSTGSSRASHKHKDIPPTLSQRSLKSTSESSTSAQRDSKTVNNRVKASQPMLDYEDDILDILSDGGNEPPKRRAKTKNTKKPAELDTSKLDSKPITLPSTLEPKETAKKLSDAKSTVTFDDDDDILGGLGFNESITTRSTSVAPPTNTRLDDLLGTNKPSKSAITITPKSTTLQDSKQDSVKADANIGDLENSFQFGSYVPSLVEGRSTKRSSLKVPSGRRKGSTNIDPTLPTRPSTASPVVKKSVRFPKDLERPSTATTPATVSSPKKEKREPVSDDTTSNNDGGVDTNTQVLTLDNSLLGNEECEGKSTNAGSRRRPLFNNPSSNRHTHDTDKLEHPVFPWQQGGSSTASRKDRTPLTTHTVSQQPAPSKPADNVGPNQSAMLATFQEQLLEQQKRLQEQLTSFQSESTAKAKLNQTEVESLHTQLKTAEEKVKEVETRLEKRNSELVEVQNILRQVQQELSVSEELREKLDTQCKETTHKLNTLDTEATQEKHNLNTQIEEIKMKLYKIELEREQLQHIIESIKSRHKEEIESIQKSNRAKLESLEESNQRRETRWKEEVATDTLRFQEKLKFLEQEKTDAILIMKKKMDALEIAKTNELGRLKDVHFSAIEELKREHELDKQHLINLHRQELETVKAAHSHTRMLSDLSHKVEVSTRDMSQLQAKLEGAHSTELEERLQRVKAHEDHVKVLEAQVMKQKLENNAERDQLQSLIAKMESHVSQQKKQLEQDRWDLQQQLAKLTAQHNAFEEERTSTMLKLETERERLEQAKEKFLSEQQDILSQCYEERRSVASERASLSVQQQKSLEREKRDKQHSLQIEAERESISKELRESRAQLVTEQATLRQHQEQLRLDREAIARDMKKLEAYGAEIQQGSKEIEQITETALLVRQQGEQNMAESQRLRDELTQQQAALTEQRERLLEKEKQLAKEQLSIAEEWRKLQELRGQSFAQPDQPLTVSSLREGYQESLLTSSYKAPSETNTGFYTPLHVSSHQQQLHTLLTKLDHSRNHRHWLMQAEKDDEYLEQETNFIQSLQTQPYIY